MVIMITVADVLVMMTRSDAVDMVTTTRGVAAVVKVITTIGGSGSLGEPHEGRQRVGAARGLVIPHPLPPPSLPPPSSLPRPLSPLP